MCLRLVTGRQSAWISRRIKFQTRPGVWALHEPSHVILIPTLPYIASLVMSMYTTIIMCIISIQSLHRRRSLQHAPTEFQGEALEVHNPTQPAQLNGYCEHQLQLELGMSTHRMSSA